MGTSLALALVLALSAGAAASPSAVCPVVEEAPEVDGVLTDAVWDGAFVHEGFTDNVAVG